MPTDASAWPWRGLACALLAALLAHAMALMLAKNHFVFSFHGPASTMPLRIRMIEPVPAPLQLPAAEPAKLPLLPQQKAPRAQNAQSVSTPEQSLSDDAPALVEKSQSIEPNQASSGVERAQLATKTIAVSELSIEANGTQSASTSGGSTEPKMIYPANARLQFDGTFMNKGSANAGSAVLIWRSDGSRYELSLEAATLVLLSRREKSEGTISAQGITPERYSSARTGRSEQATHFRYDIQRIQFSNNKPDDVLYVGTQDRLSALIQLAGIIRGNLVSLPKLGSIKMPVAGLESADFWEFQLHGTESINVPAANMQALKLSRAPRNEFDQRLELWLSPQLGYLPIRIRQSSATAPDQDFTDLVLRKLP